MKIQLRLMKPLKRSPNSYNQAVKWARITIYSFITMTTIALNLYITAEAISLLRHAATPPCRDHQRHNTTELNDTLPCNGSEVYEYRKLREENYPNFILSGIFMNSIWIYYNVAVILDLYTSKLSVPRFLVTLAFTHLLLMMLAFVVSVGRHLISFSLAVAVVCQIAINVFAIIYYVFYIICLYEMSSRIRTKVCLTKNFSVKPDLQKETA